LLVEQRVDKGPFTLTGDAAAQGWNNPSGLGFRTAAMAVDGVMAVDGAVAARLRARLLEFLKFRVLAAQGAFFADLEASPDEDAIGHFRCWLAPHWPEALALSDADLGQTLEQARHLYLD
jgi:hypothetical protein